MTTVLLRFLQNDQNSLLRLDSNLLSSRRVFSVYLEFKNYYFSNNIDNFYTLLNILKSQQLIEANHKPKSSNFI